MTSLPLQGNPISSSQYPAPPPGSNPASPTSQRNMLGTQNAMPLSMYADNSVLMMPSIHQQQQQPQHQQPVRSSLQYMPYGPGSAAPTPRQSLADTGRSPTHTPRQSLVGFDPLLPGSNHQPPSAALAALSLPNSPRIQTAMSSSPMPSPTNKHRGVRSFDAGDLVNVNQVAIEQERIRQDHIQKMRGHSVDVQLNVGAAKTLSPKPPTGHKSEKTKSPGRKRISGMFKKDKKDKKVPQRSGAAVEKPKTVQRASTVVEQPKKSQATASTSLPNSPHRAAAVQHEQQRLSMYPGIASDLMDIRMNKLELPALAKPSPTSFLTGKDDEIVRTSGEAAPFQMEIPGLPETLVIARLNLFVDTYRLTDQNFDLQQWVGYSRMDLRQVQIPQHIPIAQAILDCGDDVCLRGVVSKGSNENRLECVIFEGQRQFLAVFSGTGEQQAKGVSAKSKKKAVPLDKAHPKLEVYGSYFEEYLKLEQECFAILDKLTDEEPFCDIAFSGYSFGGAMATLGAFRYASARPTSRVSCLTMASPKAGFSLFQQMVKSQPNLKVIRLELGQDGKCQLPGVGGSHVGHTLVLNGSLGNKAEKVTQPVLAYNFGAPKPKKFGTKHPSLQAYLTALEEIHRLKLKWVKDFVGTSGKGVVVNNESRLVV